MSRSRVAGLGASLAVAVLAAFGAGGGAAADRPFSAYPSCGAKGKHADAFCFEGDRPVAVFRAFGRARVPYKLCVRKRGEKQRCHERHTRRPGQRSRASFDIDGAGKYKLAWFAEGRAVDRDALVVRERSALIVGDSLSEGTKPYLPRALSGWKLSQDVSTSRHAPEGVALLRRRSSLPSVIIFALGTNDDPHTVDSFRNSVKSVLGIAGNRRCVVVPNIVRPPVGGASYAGYNSALNSLAKQRKNLRVADWAGLIARNRGWLAADGSHVNATGYIARARLIAKQVEHC